MTTVGQPERKTQDRIISLFQDQLGYRYLGNYKDRENNSNIEEDLLKKFLERSGYSPELIRKAIFQFTREAIKTEAKDLYSINKDVYDMLRYGITVKENVGDNYQTLYLIDWENPSINDFAIAEEVTIKGENTKRPDIVLYVNGIALCVLELKRSTKAIEEGIRQNLDNQREIFIRPFFTTIQFIMAGNDSQGIRYGTIETPVKYFLSWKESSPIKNILDRHLSQLCEKSRFLELIHDFVCFDRGVKKLCRFSQYFGVKAAQESLKKREGGIIWHTQGSGKSLIMVWLTQWINENFPDARVLIVTDRTELDDQIQKTFKKAGIKTIYRTQSGKDLIDKLNHYEERLVCSLIHKFGRGQKEDAQYDDYIDELKNSLPKNFSPKGDLIVFIDECHRTQSGKLHRAMKNILPDAIFIGFTGTPLLKTDKQTTLELFGKYIHTYKFDEAVQDNVILDLCYEARDIDQDLSSPEKIDQWFETKTRGLTPYALEKLKRKWATMKSLLSSKSRLERIVCDIIHDMETRDRLLSRKGNALLVSGRIHEACMFYKLFQNNNFKRCAIITSFDPSIRNIKGESTGEDNPTDTLIEDEIYRKMLNGKSPEEFQTETIKKFVEEPAQMQLLIVVDMLLTGFDAPPATYLYIDKIMRDHGLFQAICRVNRLDGDDKKFGYIIDYKDLFRSLEQSIRDYTSGPFDNYEKSDIQGLLNNRIDKSRERLDQALEIISHLCEPVAPPKETDEFIHYFVSDESSNYEEMERNKPKRMEFYKATASLSRAYANLANEMIEAGYTETERRTIHSKVKHYVDVRSEIQHAANEYIDLKTYEADMRSLIDNYIDAWGARKISAFDEMSLVEIIFKLGIDKARSELPPRIAASDTTFAEIIENNARITIVEKTPTNPKYYERMSILLDELIQKRREDAIKYEEYLKEISKLIHNVMDPTTSSIYSDNLDTPAKRSLYDNLEKDEALALNIHNEIMAVRKDCWVGDTFKEREVLHAIRKFIPDNEELVMRIFDIAQKQKEY